MLKTAFPWLKVFDVIPGYAYAAALALVVIGGGSMLGLKTYQINTSRTEVATLKLTAEKDRGDRLQLLADHAIEIRELVRIHSKRQTEIIDESNTEKLRLKSEYALDLRRAERVRDKANANAARDRAAAENESPACKRIAEDNAALYGVANEGFSLVVEGRNLLGQAINEINTLKNIITNDRAAICSSEP